MFCLGQPRRCLGFLGCLLSRLGPPKVSMVLWLKMFCLGQPNVSMVSSVSQFGQPKVSRVSRSFGASRAFSVWSWSVPV